MHSRPPGAPPRTLMRPPLDLVERRRQELAGARGVPWWFSSRVARAAAGCVLASFFACFLIAIETVANASIVPTVDPAAAAALPPHMRALHRPHQRPVMRTDERVAAKLPVARLKRSAPAHAPAAVPQAPARARVLDPQPVQTAMPAPPPSPVSQPVTALSAQPWSLTADGTWTTVVSLAVPSGIDRTKLAVTFSSDGADVLPLDPNAAGAPGAIVSTTFADRSVTLNAFDPVDGQQSIALPPPASVAPGFRAVAAPIGPHLVDVGWTAIPPADVSEYKIYRQTAGMRHGELAAVVSPGTRSWQDDAVSPSTSYTYTVIAFSGGAAAQSSTGYVTTPPAMPPTSTDAIAGKGMFLYFTPNAAEANGYARYDPAAIVARAKSAGITHIEVRMARGTFFENSSAGARAFVDALIDQAANAGIRLIAWQVPRRATSADEAAAVDAARYQTPAGNGFAGLALDIEDGENYMGAGPEAKQRMVDHIEAVRRAVGPSYLVVATVMSPALTHWTNARYPFDRIAPFASVLQPMEYWHHFFAGAHHAYSQDEVTSACADSVAMTRTLAGRDVPINVAGQSDDLGTTGPPSPAEIGWCLAGAKSAGAIGQTFFDWRGTDDDNWSAIADFVW